MLLVHPFDCPGAGRAVGRRAGVIAAGSLDASSRTKPVLVRWHRERRAGAAIDAWARAARGDRVQLAVGKLHRLIGIERRVDLARLLFQRGSDALAAAGEFEVALVGEHDGLGAPARADHDRLGVSAGLAEPREQRGELCSCFAGGKHVVRFAIHDRQGSTNVYTYAVTCGGGQG